MRPELACLLSCVAFAGIGCSAAEPAPTGPRLELSAVTHGADRFVAVGHRRSWIADEAAVTGTRAVVEVAIVSSTDGTTWTPADVDGAAGGRELELRSVAYGNDTFVAVGDARVAGSIARGLTLRSADGMHWTEAGGPPLSDRFSGLGSIVFGNGWFVAASSGIVRSRDGLTWQEVDTPQASSMRVAFGNDRFVAYHDRTVGTSVDGQDWSWSTLDELTTLTGVSHVGDRFVLHGFYDCCFGEVPSGRAYFTGTSLDGAGWALSADPARLAFSAIAVGNGASVALRADALFAATDAAEWTPTHTVSGDGYLTAVAFAQGKFVVVGAGDILTSTDGRGWRSTKP